MCNPGILLEAGQFAVQAGSTIAGASAQAKQSKATKQAAIEANAQTYKSLDTRAGQEQDAATRTIMSADRAARATDALARTSAGAAGVAGASVDALLAGIAHDKFTAEDTIHTNLSNTLSQIDAEKKGADANMQNRINSAPAPNPFMTGLQVAGEALDTYNQSRPKPKG